MNQIFSLRKCIFLKNLNQLNELEKFDFNLAGVTFFCKDYNLSLHFKYSEKYKIIYSKKKNIWDLIINEKINCILFTNLDTDTLNEANFISNNFKSNIDSIGFFIKKNYNHFLSLNFSSKESDNQNNWNWNFGKNMISNLNIFNYFPFEARFSCEIRWPFLIENNDKEKLEKNLNRLIDNEDNIAENIENKKFIYNCNGFNQKEIIFSFEKIKNYDDDPRNLNFAIYNFKLEGYNFEENSLEKNNLFINFTNNFFNKIEIYEIDKIDTPLIEINTYKENDKFDLKKIIKTDFSYKNKFLLFSV